MANEMSATEQSAARYRGGVRVLICRDCGKRWKWSKDEQAFFKSKGWQPPARCPGCRQLNRELKKVFVEKIEPGPDRALTCQDCGAEFIWSEGEQTYYKERDWNMPKRCVECRAKYKETLRRRHQPPAFTFGDAIRRNLGDER